MTLLDDIPYGLSDRAQEFIVLPTEQCNFRCVYCYEDYQQGTMKPNVVSAFKKLLTHRVPHLDALTIHWFGGEPLLAKDIIFDISDHLLHLQKRHSNLNYTGAMTTNGYLLGKSLLERLVDAGVTQYQIALDGNKAAHDATRRRRNGEGSFDEIWGNLADIGKSSRHFNIVLRIHLTADNLAGVAEFIERLNDRFEGDARFRVFFKPVGRLGGRNEAELHVLDPESRLEVIRSLSNKLRLPCINREMDSKPYICYASKPNSLVIRSDGAINKCTVALNQERNQIGYLKDNGTLEIDQTLFRNWLHGYESQDIHALGCPLKAIQELS